MRKQYILPQTEAQTITAGQIICTSTPTIKKGGNLNGKDQGGMYV